MTPTTPTLQRERGDLAQMSHQQLLDHAMALQGQLQQPAVPGNGGQRGEKRGERAFPPRQLPETTEHLVIGTSRTRDIYPPAIARHTVVHTYRGAMLSELRAVLEKYPPIELKSVTVICGFNDAVFGEDDSAYQGLWNSLIETIIQKFHPKSLLLPDTIPSTQTESAQNVELLQTSLRSLCITKGNVINETKLYPLAIDGFFRLSQHEVAQAFFCRDGVHLNAIGTNLLTAYLAGIVRSLHVLTREQVQHIRIAKSRPQTNRAIAVPARQSPQNNVEAGAAAGPDANPRPFIQQVDHQRRYPQRQRNTNSFNHS